MPRKGENIYKRKDGRWEGRYIKSRTPAGKANYGYVYASVNITMNRYVHPTMELKQENMQRLSTLLAVK